MTRPSVPLGAAHNNNDNNNNNYNYNYDKTLIKQAS